MRVANLPGLLQQFVETGEWLVSRRRRSVHVGTLAICVGYFVPRMLILMTVETQQLPVASVRWVVVVIVILVMNGELASRSSVRNFLATLKSS